MDRENKKAAKSQPLSRRKKWFFIAATLSLGFGVPYLVYAVVVGAQHYKSLKNSSGFVGTHSFFDEELGPRFEPLTTGELVMGNGDRVPVYHDEHGFRANPHALPADGRDDAIMFLGDSFTYGYGVRAEQSYPELVGAAMGRPVINAANNGWGMAHMVAAARRYIPELKPSVVVAQMSPWLTHRSMTPFMPVFYFNVPTPYFVEDHRLERCSWRSPVFKPMRIVPTAPLSEFRGTGASLGEFLSYFMRSGLPMRLANDLQTIGYRGKRLIGLMPRPAPDGLNVTYSAYEEIAEICAQNGADLLVVGLGNWDGLVEVRPDLLPDGIIAIDTHQTMLDLLESPTERNFKKAYNFYSPSEDMMYDLHFNPVGHRVVASRVVILLRNYKQKMKEIESGTETPEPPAAP